MKENLVGDNVEITSKSEINRAICRAIDLKENLNGEWIERKTGFMIKVQITITERERFIDAKGVKWVRE